MFSRMSMTMTGAALLMAAPVTANPLQPPSVEYVAEIRIARGPIMETSNRVYYTGRKIRTDIVGNTFLYDLDRQQFTVVMPAIRKYDEPRSFGAPIADGRRWVGIEATTAEAIGTEEMLGRPTTKYKVRGFFLDSHAPFEGVAWSTSENIVLRAEGTAQFPPPLGMTKPSAPEVVKLTVTKLTIGPVDSRLFVIPANFVKSGY